MKRRLRIFSLVSSLLYLFTWTAHAQRLSRIDRERAQAMLQTVASDVRNHYYDPKLRGLDWDRKVTEAKLRIANAASVQEAMLDIAGALDAFDDSHTKFFPPSDPIPPDYGWYFQAIGDRCFVTHVQPNSDANYKGMLPGDEVISINGFSVTRESAAKLDYVLKGIVQPSTIDVDLRTMNGQVRHISVKAKVRQPVAVMDYGDLTGRDRWRAALEIEDELHLARPRYREFSDKLFILKLPTFLRTDTSFQGMINKARGHSSLILDLRGNLGGEESSLESLIEAVFLTDLNVAERVTRDGVSRVTAKGNQNAFQGKLIVLVDSRSASASELFARVVQIEKRGVVLGDRSAGAVMQAKIYPHEAGINPVYHYSTLISEADLIMSDSKSLEHHGVVPDETILPSASDLANDRDPLLAHAAAIAGITLSSEEAARLFPFEWPKK